MFGTPTAVAIEKAVRTDIGNFVESLRNADADEILMLRTKVSEGRRALEIIDPVFLGVLRRPRDFVDCDGLADASFKLHKLIRQARKEHQVTLAAAWIPWLHTLRATNDHYPDLRALGKTMWALIEPPEVQWTEGTHCLTPAGFRTQLRETTDVA